MLVLLYNMIIKIILNLLVMLTSLPIGWLLARLCEDELIIGRRWFKIILYSLIIVMIVYSLFYFNISIVFAFIYMIIVTLITIYLGKNKRLLFLKNKKNIRTKINNKNYMTDFGLKK